MKVALVSFLLDPAIGGGSATAVQTLARGLVEAGSEVVAITTHAERRPVTERSDGVTVHRFFPWNLYWVAVKDQHPAWQKVLWQLLDVWNPHAFATVRRLLERERPDVVHVH